MGATQPVALATVLLVAICSALEGQGLGPEEVSVRPIYDEPVKVSDLWATFDATKRFVIKRDKDAAKRDGLIGEGEVEAVSKHVRKAAPKKREHTSAFEKAEMHKVDQLEDEHINQLAVRASEKWEHQQTSLSYLASAVSKEKLSLNLPPGLSQHDLTRFEAAFRKGFHLGHKAGRNKLDKQKILGQADYKKELGEAVEVSLTQQKQMAKSAVSLRPDISSNQIYMVGYETGFKSACGATKDCVKGWDRVTAEKDTTLDLGDADGESEGAKMGANLGAKDALQVWKFMAETEGVIDARDDEGKNILDP